MTNWKIKTGNFLFRYRSFTPLPFIALTLFLFDPIDLGKYRIHVYFAGLLVSLAGETIRILAVGFSFPGTSGRENYLRADRLNNTGIYSVVRNPLYIGNYLMFAGLVAVFANVYALLLFSAFLIIQYYFIILAEEHFLLNKYGESYQIYRKQVRRVIPRFRCYIKNRNPFNGGKVLQKEKSSVFNLLMIYLGILAIHEYKQTGVVKDPLWFAAGALLLIVVYLAIKWRLPKVRH